MEKIKLHAWLSRLLVLARGDELDVGKSSTARLATENAMDRRRTARVLYPEIGQIGELPAIFFEGKALKIQDLSLAGTCLVDPFDYLQSTAGNVVNLDLKWSDSLVTHQPSLIVAAGNDKRHIRFIDLDVKSFVRLNLLLRPGFLGLKMRKIMDKGSPHIHLGAHEVWVGMTGEALTLFPIIGDHTPLAEITIDGQVILLYQTGAPVYRNKTDQGLPGQRIKESLLNQLVLFVTNIKSNSHHINILRTALDQAYHEYQGTKV